MIQIMYRMDLCHKINVCNVNTCMHCPASSDEKPYLCCHEQIAVQPEFVNFFSNDKPSFTSFDSNQQVDQNIFNADTRH